MNLDGRISRVVDHRRNREIVWVDSQRCRRLTDDGLRLAGNNNQRTAQYAKVHARYCRWRSDSKTGTIPMSSNTGLSCCDVGSSVFRMKSVRITQRNWLPSAPASSLTISSTDFSFVTEVVRSFKWSEGSRSFTLCRSTAPIPSNSRRIDLRAASICWKFAASEYRQWESSTSNHSKFNAGIRLSASPRTLSTAGGTSRPVPCRKTTILERYSGSSRMSSVCCSGEVSHG